MKAFAAAMLLALSEVALAKPMPVKLPNHALVSANINIGTGAATREWYYFQAPQPPRSGDLRCQLKPVQLCR